MTGLASILYLERSKDAAPCAEGMAAQLAHRGRFSIAAAGAVALVGFERLRPSLWRSPSGMIVCADARLDDTAELANTLDCPTHSAPELIGRAFLKWGAACLSRLSGDFAFCVWDADTRQLFCARDRFGVKPLYYTHTPSLFACASEIRALPAATGGAPPASESFIANYLLDARPDDTSTAYEGVSRLAAAHTLTASARGLNIQRYWSIDEIAEPEIYRKDAGDQLRHLLEKSVSRRLHRPVARCAAMLSGGLDSSTIAALASAQTAHEAPLQVFCQVFDRTPQYSERAYAQAVIDRHAMRPMFIAVDDTRPFEDRDALLSEQEGPFAAPGVALSRGLYRQAQAMGIEVLLDGHGGDEVIGYGRGLPFERAAQKDWIGLWQATAGLSAIYGDKPWGPFWNYFRRFSKLGRALGKIAPPSARTAEGAERIISAEFAARIGIGDHLAAMKAYADRAGPERELHLRALSSRYQAPGFESLDRTCAWHGIEGRYPFWDLDLVRFCLTVPARQKLQHGYPRWVLREAMADLLPDRVRWRRDKLDFNPMLRRNMMLHHGGLLDAIIERDTGGIGRYVDLNQLRNAYDRLKQASDPGGEFGLVWRCASLALWLDGAGSIFSSAAQVKPAPSAMGSLP